MQDELEELKNKRLDMACDIILLVAEKYGVDWFNAQERIMKVSTIIAKQGKEVKEEVRRRIHKVD